jgi:hypothetical protein
MKRIVTAFAGLVCLAGASIASGPAMAANELVILGQQTPFNELEIAIEGDGNQLQIVQEGGAAGAANSLDISLFGDNNGGPLGSAFSSAALEPDLMPGSIEQTGLGNEIALAVVGSGNLFAFAQHGDGNVISGTITGQANQAVVLQEGGNNYSGFSQTGIGNIISIVQRSW